MAGFCMYACLNMGYTPSKFLELSRKEQAFICASIMLKVEEEKKAHRKAKK